MKNARIRTRLLAAFSIVIVLTVLVGAMGFIGMTRIQQSVSANGTNVKAILALETIRESQIAVQSAKQMLAMANDSLQRGNQYEAIAKAKKSIEEQVKAIEGGKLLGVSMAKQWQDYTAMRQQWLDKLKIYLDDCSAYEIATDKAAKADLAEKLVTQVAYNDWAFNSAFDKSIGALITACQQQSAAIEKSSQASATTLMILLGVLLCVAIGFAVRMSFQVSGRISKSLYGMLQGLEALANGNTEIQLGSCGNDEIGRTNRAFERVVTAIRALTVDIRYLMESAEAGKLDTRADAEKHQGEYAEIVGGINSMLASITAPVSQVTEVLSRVCVNDLTVRVEGNFHGDMKVLSDAVNETIDRITETQQVFIDLSRGDMSRLEEYEAIGPRSDNDLMIPSVIKTMRTLNDLAEDAAVITAAAAGGNLDLRGDPGKYEGKYYEVIEGINHIVDAIVAPLNEASQVLEALAANDFTCSMSHGYAGAFATLSQSINSVVDTLNSTLVDINNAAEQVSSGTQQVSSGAQALSQGASEQAGTIEQLTSSLADIAEQTRQNAVNANQASEIAFGAKNEAEGGNAKMGDLQHAMKEINDASANISKIIKVIDDIAFQTNLLALNAAVEAARAGQHGRGFAVVAEEVRNLAQRSADAARETTQMIEESIKRVKAGTRMADETARSLGRIVTGVEKATELVGGIARASANQATAVAQVNSGIGQVAEVTQTNSATAEESAAASEQLSGQAQMLKEMVGRFTLKSAVQAGGGAPGRIGPGRAPRAGRPATKPKLSLSDREFDKY